MSIDHTLAFESALAELIDLVSPGLESGDLLDDAKTAGAQAYALRARVQALTTRNGELVDMIERLCNGLENYRNTAPWGDDDEDVLTEAREMAAGLNQLPTPEALTQPAWRTGAPEWTDDDSIRVIAVTADDEFAGVQFHDIKASDFHLIDEGGEVVGTEVTRLCTNWVYRDELLPIVAAPKHERLQIHLTDDTMRAIRTRALDEFGTGQAQGELWDQILMRETARTIQAAAKGGA